METLDHKRSLPVQLALTRSQLEKTDRKGRTKGVTFQLAYQLRVSPEEETLIERYGLGSHYVIGKPNDIHSYTLQGMIDGSSYSGPYTDTVLLHEQLVMKGARNAAALVSQVAAFDGRERIIDLAAGTDSDLD